jgi:pimeloyl-ACP methyl ester carboxylesterase
VAAIGRHAVCLLLAAACGRPSPVPPGAIDTLSVRVPMRRGGDGREITLPVLRFRPSGATHDVVFWFNGGPGQSNLKRGGAARLRDTFETVHVGYRGADGTPGLDCPEVTAEFRRVGDPLAADGLARLGLATAACHRRLTATGVDVDGFTALDVVDDAEAVRQALGYEKISVVGESYGTRLAYLYAARYPAHTARVALLGPNPPGRMVWNGRESDSLLAEFATRWDRTHPGRRLMDDFRAVNAHFPRSWLGLPIHEGAVRAGTFAFLFGTRQAAPALQAWQAAAQGDASGLWLMSGAAHFVFPTIVNWGDNAAKAVSADHIRGTDYRAIMLPKGSVLGAPLGYLLWSMASYWPMRPIPDEWRVARRVEAPALIIAGNLDISTPATNASRELLPVMPNARLVVLKDAGHLGDIWGAHGQATERMLSSFLATSVADTSLVHEIPADLSVDRSYSAMAKMIVAIVLLIVMLLAGATWLIARLVRRRRVSAGR